jgi:superfamily II DNA or RNA helicase
MNRTLHSHQELAIWMLRQSLSSGSKRPVLQAPTGAGKTILAAAIIEMALAKAKRVLFCVPQLSLIDQTVERLGEEGIHQVGVIQSHHPGTDSSKPIQVCSLQTLKNRKLPEADLVIVDECHVMFDFYAKWMAKPEWQKIPFIGLTATPWTKALGKLYDDLLIPTTTAELIQKINPETGEPFLSKFKVYAPSHPDLRGVKTVAGDYHEGQLSAVMSEAKLTADIVKTWLEKGEDRPTLAFCVDLAHARKLRDQFEAAGVSCGYVDAFTTRLERNEIAEKFRARLYQVVCSVGTLTTGIDWDVRCIILARPTKSEILYCLDSQTEVLTSYGWKGMGQVKPGDCVATMSDTKTGSGYWSRVLAYVEREMREDEEWVECSGPRSNLRVTDQHRMIFRSGNERGEDYGIAAARAMVSAKGGVVVPTAVKMDQPGIPLTDAELYFVGMMMTDGSWTATAGAISQSERYPEIIDRIEKCLSDCGIGYSKSRVATPQTLHAAANPFIERHPRWVYSMSAGRPRVHANTGKAAFGHVSKRAWKEVKGESGYRHLMPFMDKELSPALMAMSKSQFLVFLQGLHDGDGHKMKSPSVDWTPRSWTLCTARKTAADRLQALAAINGFTAHLRSDLGDRKNPIYIITISPQDWRQMGGYSSKDRGNRPQIELKSATKEKVWCVETETGTLVTRRKGKVTILGNCQIIGRGLRTGIGKTECLILDHSDTTLRLGFVTDIHHEALDDGESQKASVARVDNEEPKPRECPSCHVLKAPKVHVCPHCGFAPAKQPCVDVREGELVEITRKGKVDIGSKQEVYSGLLWIASARGYKEGWVANQYRQAFGVWPARLVDRPMVPSNQLQSWVTSQQIRYWKGRERSHATA